MAYLVFAQEQGARPPAEKLVAQARVHFDAVLSAVPAAGEGVAARFSYAARGECAEFDVAVSDSSAADIEGARAAERSGRGAGLADLAARCRKVWRVEPRAESADWLILEFCALLASVALGPILTPDRTALFGVRGARERANAARGAPDLTR